LQHLATTTDTVDSQLAAFASSLADLASSTSTSAADSASFRHLIESTCRTLSRTLNERASFVEAEQHKQRRGLEKRIRAHDKAVRLAPLLLVLGANRSACAVADVVPLGQIATHIDALLAPVRVAQASCAALLGDDARALAALQEADAAALINEVRPPLLPARTALPFLALTRPRPPVQNNRLKLVIARLQAHLADEAAHLRSEEDAIIARVRDELAAASERRLRGLKAAYGEAEEGVEGVVRSKEGAVRAREKALGGLVERNGRVERQLDEMAAGCARAAEGGQQVRSLFSSSVS